MDVTREVSVVRPPNFNLNFKVQIWIFRFLVLDSPSCSESTLEVSSQMESSELVMNKTAKHLLRTLKFDFFIAINKSELSSRAFVIRTYILWYEDIPRCHPVPPSFEEGHYLFSDLINSVILMWSRPKSFICWAQFWKALEKSFLLVWLL